MTDQLRILTPTNEPRTAEDVVNDAAASGDVGAWTLSEATGPQWQYALDANGDYVSTDDAEITNVLPYAGNIILQQTETNTTRKPHLDKPNRAFTGTGADYRRFAWPSDPPTLTATTRFACLIRRTSTLKGIILGGSTGGDYCGAFESGSSSPSIQDAGTSPEQYVDEVLFTGTRNDLYNTLTADTWHLYEVVFDGTATTWPTSLYMFCNSSANWGVNGDFVPLYLGPNVNTADLAILRERWYEQYPQIAPVSGAIDATGAVTFSAVTATGSASREVKASGSPSIDAVTAVGSASIPSSGQTANGSANITLGMTATGSASRGVRFSGTGIQLTTGITSTGSAVKGVKVSGNPDLFTLTSTITATKGVKSQDGAGTITFNFNASGTADRVGVKNASGSPEITLNFEASGTAAREIESSGTATLDSLTATGLAGGSADLITLVSAPDALSSGQFVSFNFATRHGATFVQASVNGSLGMESTQPTALPNLAAVDLDIDPDFMGTISRLILWDDDVGASAIETISAT